MQRRPTITAIALLIAAVPLAGCRTTAELLYDRRVEATHTLDQLYGRYGGSPLAGAVTSGIDAAASLTHEEPNGFLSSLGNAAREADRAAFEGSCSQLGRGERPLLLTDKARTFFEQSSTRDDCHRYVRLRAEIRRMEAELASTGRR